MEDFNSFYHYQESVEAMKNKLRSMTYELQSTKMEATEATVKYRQNVKQLLHMLQTACRERDEARQEINKLLLHNRTTTTSIPIIPVDVVISHSQYQDKNPAGKTNSTITDSPDPTTPFNNSLFSHSHSSSPGGSGSLYDVVSPHDFSSSDSAFTTSTQPMNFPPQEFSTTATGITEIIAPPRTSPPSRATTTTIDNGDLIIASIASARTKALPKKGRLLQAVLEAGPLLQTLMLAGPLPQWRNPPPPLQPLHHHHFGFSASRCTGAAGISRINNKLKRSYSSRESGGGLENYGAGDSVLRFSAGCEMVSPRGVFGFGHDQMQQVLPVAKSQRIRSMNT